MGTKFNIFFKLRGVTPSLPKKGTMTPPSSPPPSQGLDPPLSLFGNSEKANRNKERPMISHGFFILLTLTVLKASRSDGITQYIPSIKIKFPFKLIFKGFLNIKKFWASKLSHFLISLCTTFNGLFTETP